LSIDAEAIDVAMGVVVARDAEHLLFGLAGREKVGHQQQGQQFLQHIGHAISGFMQGVQCRLDDLGLRWFGTSWPFALDALKHPLPTLLFHGAIGS
jgi:hypothetical protein